MKRANAGAVVGLSLVVVASMIAARTAGQAPETQKVESIIKLPQPQTTDGMGLDQALATRRSIRRFTGRPLTREQIGQLAWAAQGITSEQGYRTAPSAGALYPLQVLVATADGLFTYDPRRHALLPVNDEDVRDQIVQAAMGQKWIAKAGGVFVLAGNNEITARKYGRRAQQFVWQETGHAAQNLLLQATSLGLGATPVGAFDEDRLSEVLQLPEGWQAVYVLPVGVPQ